MLAMSTLLDIDVSSELEAFDDMSLVSYDRKTLLPEPDIQVKLTVLMNNFQVIHPPKVPTLYTVLSAGDLASNAPVYGEYTHPVVLDHNAVVEIVLENQDTGSHPSHLHGHSFQLLTRYPSYGAAFYDYSADMTFATYNSSNETIASSFPTYPARCDTLALPLEATLLSGLSPMTPGLAMTFVKNPMVLQQRP
ncbi:ferro-O2-oxidoreductase [Penicillium malachiteum]|uniref:ferro-O2-oxidoreductase n=1 Tax=Penicillium malachiteum TaxID=1324776 RepID=UPI002547C984|nr:ferro-O2-oxidoreductase [Penicillium malachiteum]KAJ5721166.1 ferro-O2-oxidoreductase [Penicillium malachiteum]